MEPSSPAAKPVTAHGSRPPSPAAKALKGGVAQLKRLKGFFHTNLSALQMSFSPAAADDLDEEDRREGDDHQRDRDLGVHAMPCP